MNWRFKLDKMKMWISESIDYDLKIMSCEFKAVNLKSWKLKRELFLNWTTDTFGTGDLRTQKLKL